MPRPARAPETDFARSITNQVRRQADQRIHRNVREIDTGVVASISPLKIRPRSHATTNITLEAGDVAIVPGIPLFKGQNVILARTAGGDFIVLPVVPGNDWAPGETRRGTTGGVDSGPGATTAVGLSGPAGDRVIQVALSYVGVSESPLGSNTGHPKIDEWHARWSNGPVAWCGEFADAMYFEAGVDDEGLGSPSTQAIYDKAKADNKLRDRPVKGAFIVSPSNHVTLYISGPMNNALTVGGNQGAGAVTSNNRDVSGWGIAVPNSVWNEATAENV